MALENLPKIFGWLSSCEYWPGTIWLWGQTSCFEFDKIYTAEMLFNFLKMLHQHPLEREEKELTSLSKHTTLIFLFSLNSAKNLNNRLKHSHTKWNFRSQMKEGVFPAAGAVTSHSLANKIHLHLQRLPSGTSPGWCLWVTKSPLISTLSFQRQTEESTSVPTTKPTDWRVTEFPIEPPAEGWAMVGIGQQFQAVGQSLTAGPTQQWPLMGLHTAKWASTCQQLRNNGMVLVAFGRMGFSQGHLMACFVENMAYKMGHAVIHNPAGSYFCSDRTPGPRYWEASSFEAPLRRWLVPCQGEQDATFPPPKLSRVQPPAKWRSAAFVQETSSSVSMKGNYNSNNNPPVCLLSNQTPLEAATPGTWV